MQKSISFLDWTDLFIFMLLERLSYLCHYAVAYLMTGMDLTITFACCAVIIVRASAVEPLDTTSSYVYDMEIRCPIA